MDISISLGIFNKLIRATLWGLLNQVTNNTFYKSNIIQKLIPELTI